MNTSAAVPIMPRWTTRRVLLAEVLIVAVAIGWAAMNLAFEPNRWSPAVPVPFMVAAARSFLLFNIAFLLTELLNFAFRRYLWINFASKGIAFATLTTFNGPFVLGERWYLLPKVVVFIFTAVFMGAISGWIDRRRARRVPHAGPARR